MTCGRMLAQSIVIGLTRSAAIGDGLRHKGTCCLCENLLFLLLLLLLFLLLLKRRRGSDSVASLRLMSRGAVTDGVTLFYPQKVMTFLVIVNNYLDFY